MTGAPHETHRWPTEQNKRRPARGHGTALGSDATGTSGGLAREEHDPGNPARAKRGTASAVSNPVHHANHDGPARPVAPRLRARVTAVSHLTRLRLLVGESRRRHRMAHSALARASSLGARRRPGRPGSGTRLTPRALPAARSNATGGSLAASACSVNSVNRRRRAAGRDASAAASEPGTGRWDRTLLARRQAPFAACDHPMRCVRLRPFERHHLALVEPWFRDADTQRWLGGPAWPQRHRRYPGLGRYYARFPVPTRHAQRPGHLSHLPELGGNRSSLGQSCPDERRRRRRIPSG